jgi:hypothetical protein
MATGLAILIVIGLAFYGLRKYMKRDKSGGPQGRSGGGGGASQK